MMNKQSFYYMSAVVIVICFASKAFCDMSSANYDASASVFPGGGMLMTSTNYDVKATLGQPSPPRKDSDPPESPNYVLYPGFWYTIHADKVKIMEIKYMPWIPLLLLDE